MDAKFWGALLYASVPTLIGVYLLLVLGRVLKDRTGKDDLYQWILGNRAVWFVVALLLIALGVFEFFRYVGSYSLTREECIRAWWCSI